jgi:TetR/AcrR family transcriptional regulator, tetracycline repressor protein
VAGRGKVIDPRAVVATAVRVADTEGLEAVTVRRLAGEHGVTPMALYWHFRDKDAVLDAMAAELLDHVDLPAPVGDWAGDAEAVLREVARALRPHPVAASLVVNRMLGVPTGLAVAERLLTALRAGGFDPAAAAEAVRFTLTALVAQLTSVSWGPPVPEGERRVDRQLAAVSADDHPRVAESADTLARCGGTPSYAERSLQLLVSGLRALAVQQAAR